MKILFYIALILITFDFAYSRSFGETEILAEDGIEVFQNEKYYLLKKNVEIKSDNFYLSGDEVKIYFNKDLYDIKSLHAVGNVKLDSKLYKISGSGNELYFLVKSEEVTIIGENSSLILDEIKMRSNNEIMVNNLTGSFSLFGKNSNLTTNLNDIRGEKIIGKFSTSELIKEILFIEVEDKDGAYIKSGDTEMYAQKSNYSKENSQIEMNDDVIIIRGGEKITGDYGIFDTKNKSYKIKSKNKNKVKVTITNSNE